MKPPDPDRLEAFSIGLFREHLEEASFLYEQRGVLLRDPQVAWTAVGPFEDRFEAHIDALVLGGPTALDLCLERAAAGDGGELHAALTVFCRRRRLDLVEQTMALLDPDDAERLQAARDAFKHNWPDEWQEQMACLIREKQACCLEVFPEVAGFRRYQIPDVLTETLPDCPQCSLDTQLWSLGRLKNNCSPAALIPFLDCSDEHIRAVAALGLSRMGVCLADSVPAEGRQLAFWHLVHIALTAGRPYVTHLLSALQNMDDAPDTALALGLLGDSAAVEPLIERLSRTDDPETLALALHLITGADLTETVVVAEPLDEDLLMEDEKPALQNGQAPEGLQSKTELVRLSRDPVAWQAWWHRNRPRFQPGMRYRHGLLYSPAALLATLRSGKSPPMVRRIAAEELVTRYLIDIPFEVDMTVRDQIRALNHIEKAIAAQARDFTEGVWYFAGRVVT